MQNVVRVGESAASTSLRSEKRLGWSTSSLPKMYNTIKVVSTGTGAKVQVCDVCQQGPPPPRWRGRAPRGIASAAAVKTERHLKGGGGKKKKLLSGFVSPAGWGGGRRKARRKICNWDGVQCR